MEAMARGQEGGQANTHDCGIARAFRSYRSPCNFFFSGRRRHTRCLSDWSSDVCSSDLWLTDPNFVDIPVDRLISKQYADERRRLIDSERALDIAAVAPGIAYTQLHERRAPEGDRKTVV